MKQITSVSLKIGRATNRSKKGAEKLEIPPEILPRVSGLFVLTLVVFVGLNGPGGLCAEEPFTPPPGSPLRASLCDVLRDEVYPERHKEGFKVQFQIDHLKVDGDWACFSGVAELLPKPEDMGEIPGLSAVFQRAADGRWKCLAWDFHGDLSLAKDLFGDVAVPNSVLPDWMRSEPLAKPRNR